MDFAKLILYQASIGPDRPALAFTGGVATYGVLAGAVAAARGRIATFGLPPRSIVAIDVRNPFHHTALLVALALEGVASASVQNSFAIESSGLTVDLLLADRYAAPAPSLRSAAVDESWFDHDPTRPPDFAKFFAAPGMTAEEQVIRVVFSSGTTGRPKAVAITSGVLGRRFANASFTYGGTSLAGSRVLCMMGFSTLPAFMSTFGTLAGGGLICHAPSAAETLQLVQLFQVGLVSATPHQLQALLAAQGPAAPPPSLHTLIVGGARMPRALITEARARLCGNLMVGYGSTEAGSIAHVPASVVEAIEGGAGYVLPWATLEVVDDDGNPLPAGQEGRFRVRSNELAGYVTERLDDIGSLAGDWFYPGDVGAIDANGIVIVTGRSVEVINRGGAIVAPDLIEEVLRASGMVADCAAFVATAGSGAEEIWAAVVPTDGYDERRLSQLCRARLADRAPERYLEVASIPRNDMGKIMRGHLKDMARSGSAEGRH